VQIDLANHWEGNLLTKSMMTCVHMPVGPGPKQTLTFLLKDFFVVHSQSLQSVQLEG
jgi:hypothetical protein